MNSVDLENIGLTIPYRWEAIKWLEKTYGTMDKGYWKISEMRYVTFKNDKDATLFVLKWSS